MTSKRLPITDEEFAALLARPLHSELSPGDDDAGLSTMKSALRSYRAETLQWAERRSAGQPSLAAAARSSERWAALPRWSLAMVALVTIAGGVVHLADSRAAVESPAPAADVAVTSPGRPTPTDIAADNRLLSSIDAELSYHSASPVDSLQLVGGQNEHPADDVRGVTD